MKSYPNSNKKQAHSSQPEARSSKEHKIQWLNLPG